MRHNPVTESRLYHETYIRWLINEGCALHSALPSAYIASGSDCTRRSRRLSVPVRVVSFIDEFVTAVTDYWHDEHRDK